MRLQKLPAKATRLCLSVESFIKEDLSFCCADKHLLLAYSGGADSKALFFILKALLPRLGFTFSIAHLNHSLRETSSQEAFEAEELAKTHGLRSYSKVVNIEELALACKISTEEAGRNARLQFLKELQAEIPNTWIVLGHQLNDLAEDSLMRLIRGSGWPALAGMQALNLERKILRPLLLTPRAMLEDFLNLLHEDWVKDPLNEDQAYLRNRVRKQILPLFLAENPNFLKGVAQRWQLASFDAEQFAAEEALIWQNSKLLQKGIDISPQGISLQNAELQNLCKSQRLRLYKSALEKLGSGQPLTQNLLNLDKAWLSKSNGKILQFPGFKTAQVLKLGIVFKGKI